LRALSQDVVRLRRLWDEHIHLPFPASANDPRLHEVALYASWLGSMVEVALRHGTLDPVHAEMLKTRRAEGNQALFRASGELGDPVRSYVARLIAIEDILSGLPVE
jgi:alkylhydroperoxidase family enzyme